MSVMEWYTNIIENNGGEAMAIHMIKYATDAGLGGKYECVSRAGNDGRV
ncbi:MAG: hypothetical protein ACLVJK_12345 [Alistipes putredinis]